MPAVEDADVEAASLRRHDGSIAMEGGNGGEGGRQGGQPDLSNSSHITTSSSIQQGSSAGTGSLPRQYPGRTYYYRAPSASLNSAGLPMSLTQSHFDIREGRLLHCIALHYFHY
jgi:hypothetical protein